MIYLFEIYILAQFGFPNSTNLALKIFVLFQWYLEVIVMLKLGNHFVSTIQTTVVAKSGSDELKVQTLCNPSFQATLIA